MLSLQGRVLPSISKGQWGGTARARLSDETWISFGNLGNCDHCHPPWIKSSDHPLVHLVEGVQRLLISVYFQTEHLSE